VELQQNLQRQLELKDLVNDVEAEWMAPTEIKWSIVWRHACA